MADLVCNEELPKRDKDGYLVGPDILYGLLYIGTHCPLCDQAVQRTEKRTARTLKVIMTHFCSFMNGDCKVERTYKKERVREK